MKPTTPQNSLALYQPPYYYEAYGVESDPERIRFYRLMYDLAS